MRKIQITTITNRFRGAFDGFTAGQRTVTAIAVIVAIIGGVVFFSWASKPTLVPLYSGLSNNDASAITAKLTESGTTYALADDGQTILVPAPSVSQTRLDLAGQGLPAEADGGGDGYSLLDKQTLTSSDFDKRMAAKRATEGELRKTIEAIDKVAAAKVLLALPEQDVFTSQQAKTSASVQVTMRPSAKLDPSQVDAIVHLTAAAVPKLSPADVTVTDSAGKLLNAPGANGAATSMGEQRSAQIAAVSSETSRRIQDMLDTVVGPGNSTVHVQADLNFNNTKRTTKTYIQPPANASPLTESAKKETMKGNGQNPVGGVLGPDNITVPNNNPGNASSDYQNQSSDRVNAVGTQTDETDVATGDIRRLGISVIISQNSPVTAAQIQQNVIAAAAADPRRGDVVVVSKMPFDTKAADAAAQAQEEAAAQARMDELQSLAKNVLLGLALALALIIGFRKSRKKSTVVDLGELPSAGVPELAMAQVAPTPLEYQLDDEPPAIQATPVDPQSQARVHARREIGQLVNDSPEEVARLLRGWISERS